MKIISVLGTGWLGLPLCNKLKQLGYRVKGSTRSEHKLAALKANGIEAYLLDMQTIENADDSFWHCDSLIINTTCKDLPSHQQLADIVAGQNIKQVIFVSSTSVYSPSCELVYEDQQLENPEHILRNIELTLTKQIPELVVVRFSGLIGGRRHPGRFFRREGGVTKDVNNAGSPVNLIHGVDCLNILTEIIRQQVVSEDFNCAADSHPSKHQFYQHAGQQLGLPELNFIDIEKTKPNKVVVGNKVKQKLNLQFAYDDLLSVDFSVETEFDQLSKTP